MAGYEWRPIEDLPVGWEDLCANDLSSLSDIWIEEREKLQDSGALKQFNSRLKRQWAIETGIIESLYTIDRGITEILIEKGIEASLIPHGTTDRPVGEIIPIIKDQESVVEGLFDFVANKRQLSMSYVKDVHQALTAHQNTAEAVDSLGHRTQVPLIRGQWKQHPNNPTRADDSIHEYCPPEQVDSEMERLIDMHLHHNENDVAPELEASWLHHRFTQIHPFQDGNGRVARALASVVFIRAKWFPLVLVSSEHRNEYIEALEKADEGDLQFVVSLFARLQKDAFRRALSISDDVIGVKKSVQAAVESVAERLSMRKEEKEAERKKVFDLSTGLQQLAFDRLSSLKDDLQSQLHSISPETRLTVVHNDEQSKRWYWNQVVETARAFSYYADMPTYHAWVRLKIEEERKTHMVFSFHSLGTKFLGVMAVSAFIEHRAYEKDDKDDRESIVNVDGPHTICREIFEFSFNQELEALQERFERWLNEALVNGLDQLKRQL